eukprot:424428-Alexandrium_andersonii.AAC.1
MASRDAIRNGRVWIERNSAIAPRIAGRITKRIVFLQTYGGCQGRRDEAIHPRLQAAPAMDPPAGLSAGAIRFT